MIKRIIYILIFANLPLICISQDILENRFTKDELKEILIPREEWEPVPNIENRAFWDNLSPEIKELYIIEAESIMEYKWSTLPADVTLRFVRDGNRSEYEALSFLKRHNLTVLTIAEVIENKGRFTDKIMNGVWSICEESYWGVPAHLKHSKSGSGLPDIDNPWVDLFAAETVNTLAWVDYFLGDKLDEISPLIRKRIKLEADKRIFNAILKDRHIWQDFRFNWNPWICSNWLNSILLLEPDQEIRAKHVSMILEALDNFLTPYPEDGGCDEGPLYWSVAGGSLYENLEIMNLATNGKYQFYDVQKIKNIGSYIYKMHIGKNNFVNFADSKVSFTPQGYWIGHIGKKNNDPLMQQFGGCFSSNQEYIDGAWHLTRKLLILTDDKKEIEFDTLSPLLQNVWFSNIQLMLSRDIEKSDKGYCVAAKGGSNNEAHNHNDVGSFMIYYDGNPVIIDVGAPTYTAKYFSSKRYDCWMANAAHHNVPMVNGYVQHSGGEYRATEVEYSKSKKEASLKMELKNAYPDGAGIESWKRIIKHRRGKGIELHENVILQSPGEFSDILMTKYLPDISQKGKIILQIGSSKDFSIEYDSEIIEVTFTKMELNTPEDEAIKQNWGDNIYRIELKSKRKMKAAEFKIKFTVIK